MSPYFSFDGSVHFGIDFYGWHLRLSQLYQESESVEHAPRQARRVAATIGSLLGAQAAPRRHPLLLFNFDGTIRSGLGDTRRAQVGVSVRF